jgi:hypothetical protein
VVDAAWVRQLELLARSADVTIFWGFGDNQKTDSRALNALDEAARRSNQLAIVRVDDTHAKVLVSDAYYIKTSFNWLSFRGDRSRNTAKKRATSSKTRCWPTARTRSSCRRTARTP